MTVCVDCGKLPAAEQPKVPRDTDVDVHPRSPRCATHRRIKRKQAKADQRVAYQTRVYGLSADDHAELLEYQGGRCYICQRATGRTKALATDHNHDCCPGDTSCGQCVRGKLCTTCNRIVIGQYDVDALLRAVEYLHDPPMARLRRGEALRAPVTRSTGLAGPGRPAGALAATGEAIGAVLRGERHARSRLRLALAHEAGIPARSVRVRVGGGRWLTIELG